MARIRTLKPEAPQHRKIGRLSIHARWLWVVMITQADDQGRLVADAEQLRLWAFGYDFDVSNELVDGWLQEIARTGLVRLYTVRAVRYCVFDSWRDHQKIDRPTPSKLPDPPPLRSTRTRRTLDEPSTSARRGSDQKDQIKDLTGGEREGREHPVVDRASTSNGHQPDPTTGPDGWPLDFNERKQAMLNTLKQKLKSAE